MSTTLKSFATPLAVGAFTISAVTGLLIFFDVEIGMVEPVHKWLSWLLVTAVLLHVMSNWKQLSGYFSKKPALAIIGAALIVTVASLLPMFGEGEEGEEREGKKAGGTAVRLLESSSLETLALVVKTTPQQLVEQLGKSGVVVKDPSLTIQEIARQNGKEGKAVLGAALAESGAAGQKDGDRD
ncbi:MAG: DUF4405 domain-containing protein [Chlorobiaceae bacterium]|nr:DUF4405 domain-containing protein [Chlorobiaceae bacterium]